MTEGLRELYRQHDLPIFQNRMYDTADAARSCPKGDVHLVEDLVTGLVRNSAFDASLMDYDQAYQNEQGTSALFGRHIESVADLVEACMGRVGLVEVGCGKGTFLELLLRRGIEVAGFDPTYEGSNPVVRKEYFSEELGLRGEGLVLRHVLEHIENPVSFLKRLAEANGGRGLIYIEVPCFDWICENRAWYDIFYEHVNYFRLNDFGRMFGRIVHADRAFGGQYLRIIGDLATVRTPVRNPADAPTLPPDFTDRLEAQTRETAAGATIVWGGASKGVIFSLLRERAGHPVQRVIDINPDKQGRYLPATGLRVMSPAEGLAGLQPGTTIHVMNPNYLEEIRAMGGPSFKYKGMSNE